MRNKQGIFVTDTILTITAQNIRTLGTEKSNTLIVDGVEFYHIEAFLLFQWVSIII